MIIAYLVTEMEVSGRAVSKKDLCQLKKWTHNQGAVLRRAVQASSDLSAVEAIPPPRGSAFQIAQGATKRVKVSAGVTGVEEDRMPSVPVKERKGPRFFDPHRPPTEGDFASAGRRAAVPGGDEGGPMAGIIASSRVDVPVRVVCCSRRSAWHGRFYCRCFCADYSCAQRGATGAQQRGGPERYHAGRSYYSRCGAS